MNFKCICGNKSTENTSNLSLNLPSNYNVSDTQYPGSSIANMYEDVSYSETNNFIQSILWGAKWINLPNNELKWTINYGNAGKTSVKFYEFTSSEMILNLITPSDEVIEDVKNIMNELTKIINISTTQVDDINEAIISFNFVEGDQSELGFAGIGRTPVVTTDVNYDFFAQYTRIDQSFYCSGNIYIVYNENTTTNFGYSKGSALYTVIVHELGHVLGLAHPHDEGGTSETFDGVSEPYDEFGTYNANLQPLTIMTYNIHQSEYTPSSYSDLGFLATFGPIDIVALQFMYGAATDTTDTTYTFPNASNRFWETIWDNGGNDTIDASNAGSGISVIIDLNDATVEHNTEFAGVTLSSNLYGGFTIANGTMIENVITGTGDNEITGNEADNNITITGGGDDTIDGQDGLDTVIINNDKSNFTITEGDEYIQLDEMAQI